MLHLVRGGARKGKKMANENTEYEKLTQDIYQALNSSTEHKTLDVQHNIKLEGKSGCKHQIDVYWEFEMMGEVYKVAIECKNYSNKVSIGKIRDFFGVLSDVGNIKGIFVTKVGYQSGAETFANYYNITLQEIRIPKDMDWINKLTKYIIKEISYSIEVIDMKFNLDESYSNNHKIQEKDSEILIEKINAIFDENNNQITTTEKISKKIPHDRISKNNLIYEEKFNNAYTKTINGDTVKIKSITFIYNTVLNESQTSYDGKENVEAVFIGTKKQNPQFYTKDKKLI